MKSTRLFAVAAAAGLALSAVGFASAGGPGKTTICHYTGSVTNTMVMITIGKAAVSHHVTSPGHGHQGDDGTSSGEGCSR